MSQPPDLSQIINHLSLLASIQPDIAEIWVIQDDHLPTSNPKTAAIRFDCKASQFLEPHRPTSEYIWLLRQSVFGELKDQLAETGIFIFFGLAESSDH